MRLTPLLAGAALLVPTAPPATADTLREALTRAYRTNPTLTAERANVRANDENVPIAAAAGRPESNVTSRYEENILNSPGVQNSFTAPGRQVISQIGFSVPLLTFGAVRGQVRAAERRAAAGRLNLRGVEADLFTQVVGAYMDVIRDDAIVALNIRNVQVLEVNLRANADRYEAGDASPTDVAQSRGRLALARSELQTARARLVASRETYVRLVGSAPGTLADPPTLPNLPRDVATAVTIALRDNPNLLAAQENSQAAVQDIRVAAAGRLPRLNAVANGSYYDYLGSIRGNPFTRTYQASSTASVGLELRVPLLQGGRTSAQIRQAQARHGQAAEQVLEAERAVVAQVRSAFAGWQAAEEVIATARTGVEANRQSLEGVRAENQMGARTILDLLNAEQELLNAEVTLVTARRDAYVAGFALLAAMGKAEARDLGLDGGALYDPMAHYDRVRNRSYDFAIDHEPPVEATPTVAVPVQDATVTRPLGPPAPVVPR